MKCPIKFCDKPHKNQIEHYADMTAPVVKSPIVTKSLLKEAVIIKPTPLPVPKPLLKAKTNSERSAAWRAKNREKYNESQRELMRKRKYDSEEEGT